MAAVHGKSATFSLDDSGGTPRDLSTYVTDVSLDFDADTDETTGLGAAGDAKTYVAGFSGASLSVSLMWDATTDGYIEGVIGAEGTFSFSPDGGSTTYSGEAILTGYSVSAGRGGAVTSSASLIASGQVTRA